MPWARARRDQSLKGHKVGLKRDPRSIRLKADAIIRNTYRTLMSLGSIRAPEWGHDRPHQASSCRAATLAKV